MNQHPQAAAVAAAVACRDRDRLAAQLADTVRLRALLPAGPIEDHGRDAVLDRFECWFGGFDTVALADVAGEMVGDRLLVHYRLLFGQPPAEPTTARRTCTQTSICRLDRGRVTAIDLLCSGFREV